MQPSHTEQLRLLLTSWDNILSYHVPKTSKIQTSNKDARSFLPQRVILFIGLFKGKYYVHIAQRSPDTSIHNSRWQFTSTSGMQPSLLSLTAGLLHMLLPALIDGMVFPQSEESQRAVTVARSMGKKQMISLNICKYLGTAHKQDIPSLAGKLLSVPIISCKDIFLPTSFTQLSIP